MVRNIKLAKEIYTQRDSQKVLVLYTKKGFDKISTLKLLEFPKRTKQGEVSVFSVRVSVSVYLVITSTRSAKKSSMYNIHLKKRNRKKNKLKIK